MKHTKLMSKAKSNEVAWVRFFNVSNAIWEPVRHEDGRPALWNTETFWNGTRVVGTDTNTIEMCRKQFPNKSWEIAPTSQMLMDNGVRDNL